MLLRSFRLHCPILFPAVVAATLLAVLGAAGDGRAADVDVLRIGRTGALTGKADGPNEKTALDELHAYIKEEIGLESDIRGPKGWQEVAEKMAAGQLEVSVFQGYEFAWAQEKRADLKPLAVAVNVVRYPTACVITRRDASGADLASLKGRSLSLPVASEGVLRLFLERHSDVGGKKMEDYFSKVTLADDAEDTLDDVVDGAAQVAGVERATLDAYKERKPGRFKQLKEVVCSQPFPPTVVAYYGSVVDEATLRRLKDGLLGASGKPKGQTLLTLAHLTGFEAVPEDFGHVIAETRKAYPAEAGKK